MLAREEFVQTQRKVLVPRTWISRSSALVLLFFPDVSTRSDCGGPSEACVPRIWISRSSAFFQFFVSMLEKEKLVEAQVKSWFQDYGSLEAAPLCILLRGCLQEMFVREEIAEVQVKSCFQGHGSLEAAPLFSFFFSMIERGKACGGPSEVWVSRDMDL